MDVISEEDSSDEEDMSEEENQNTIEKEAEKDQISENSSNTIGYCEHIPKEVDSPKLITLKEKQFEPPETPMMELSPTLQSPYAKDSTYNFSSIIHSKPNFLQRDKLIEPRIKFTRPYIKKENKDLISADLLGPPIILQKSKSENESLFILEKKEKHFTKRYSSTELKNKRVFRENMLRTKKLKRLSRVNSPKRSSLLSHYGRSSFHPEFSSEILEEEEFNSKNKYMMKILEHFNVLSNKFEFLLIANNESIKMMSNFNQKLGKIDEKVLYGGKRRNILW